MKYWTTTPPSPITFVTRVNGPINSMHPSVFLNAALIEHTLAIQEWGKLFIGGGLNQQTLVARLTQKDAARDIEVHYTLNVSPQGYQLDFYI